MRGRLKRETKAQGWVLEYDYDLAGNKVEFSLTVNSTVNVTAYACDEANRLKTVVDPEEGESSYAYDLVGNRASLSYPNAVVAEYTYDARNRLTDLHNHVGETTISRHAYTHHPDGNRARLTSPDTRATRRCRSHPCDPCHPWFLAAAVPREPRTANREPPLPFPVNLRPPREHFQRRAALRLVQSAPGRAFPGVRSTRGRMRVGGGRHRHCHPH